MSKKGPRSASDPDLDCGPGFDPESETHSASDPDSAFLSHTCFGHADSSKSTGKVSCSAIHGILRNV
eukprot:2629309-Rhodomonas_salina.1